MDDGGKTPIIMGAMVAGVVFGPSSLPLPWCVLRHSFSGDESQTEGERTLTLLFVDGKSV